MMYLIGALITILLFVIIVQIGKVNELAARLRGEEQAARDGNEWNARMMLVFLVGFLALSVGSAVYYYPYMLGYGPNILPTIHAPKIMQLFNITLFFTGVVFVITHILLFLFAYQYRESKNRVAEFIPHDNKLEIIWTAVPAVVMAILVVFGLMAWNETMADVDEEGTALGAVKIGSGDIKEGTKDYIEIEATGLQFNWILRHPGKDGQLGTKNWQLITGSNQLGQDFADPKNIDDIILDELVIPKGHTIRARITSRDVLHNFDIPHFFVKMDAIPGMPTYFKFTPTMTTEEYREHLSQFPEWQVPAEEDEPNGLQRWEAFDFELACAELCGKGHYSMKKIVKVVTEEEYNAWLDKAESTAFYLNEIRGTDDDPFLDRPTLQIEKRVREYEVKQNPPAPGPSQDPSTTPQPEVQPGIGGTTGSIQGGTTGSTTGVTGTSTIGTTIQNAAATGNTAVNNASNAVSTGVQSVKNAGENAVNGVKDAAGNVIDKTKDAAGTVIDKTKEAAGTAVDKTKEAAGNVIDKTKDKAGDVKDKMKDKNPFNNN